jgi:hypothetical protein
MNWLQDIRIARISWVLYTRATSRFHSLFVHFAAVGDREDLHLVFVVIDSVNDSPMADSIPYQPF